MSTGPAEDPEAVSIPSTQGAPDREAPFREEELATQLRERRDIVEGEYFKLLLERRNRRRLEILGFGATILAVPILFLLAVVDLLTGLTIGIVVVVALCGFIPYVAHKLSGDKEFRLEYQISRHLASLDRMCDEICKLEVSATKRRVT